MREVVDGRAFICVGGRNPTPKPIASNATASTICKGHRIRRNNEAGRLQKYPDALTSTLCYAFLVDHYPQGAPHMEWITPQHEEIDLNCEISSYANAEL